MAILPEGADRRDIPDADNRVDVANEAQQDYPSCLIPIEPVEFFAEIEVKHETAHQAMCEPRQNKKGLTVYPASWHDKGLSFPEWAEFWARGRKNAFVTLGVYGDLLNDYGNRARTIKNSIAFRSHAIDVDVGATHAKPGYDGGADAFGAIEKFVMETGLTPSLAVSTGTGGWHLWWTYDRLIATDEYIATGKRIMALAFKHGLKIDNKVGADAAQVMRAPGSIHGKTGRTVKAFRWEVSA